jgi:hypothetical protein
MIRALVAGRTKFLREAGDKPANSCELSLLSAEIRWYVLSGHLATHVSEASEAMAPGRGPGQVNLSCGSCAALCVADQVVSAAGKNLLATGIEHEGVTIR